MTVVGKKPWSSEEDERIRAMALRGKSLAVIAESLNRTEKATRNRASRIKVLLGKSQRFWRPAKGK